MGTTELLKILNQFKLSTDKPIWTFRVGKKGIDVPVIELLEELIELRGENYALKVENSELKAGTNWDDETLV